MICNYCLKDKPLCKAHIIPEYFARTILPADNKPLMLVSTEVHYTQTSWLGDYDPNILCADCDGLIGKWDDAGINFFKNTNNWKVLASSESSSLLEADVSDYSKLKLFCISLLWRASISKRTMYNAVKLGPYEKIAFDSLQKKDAGNENFFSVFITKFRAAKNIPPEMKDTFHRTIFAPVREKIQGCNFYVFKLNEFVVYIKVTNARIPDLLKESLLKPGQPLIVLEQAYEGSFAENASIFVVAAQQRLKAEYDKNPNKRQTRRLTN